MPTKLIGSLPYQAPRNADLGTAAFMDADQINIGGGAISLGASNTQGYFQSTDISDVKPSLMLDFANSKQLDPRITFTRASTATYYDGKTVAKAEENLLSYSNLSSGWNIQHGLTYSITPEVIAPDGTFNAAKFVLTSTNLYPAAYQSHTTVAGTTYTHSFYVKAGSGVDYITTSVFQSSTVYTGVCFRISTASVVSTLTAGSAFTLNSSGITSVGNGWYRVYFTFTAQVANTVYLWMGGATSSTISDYGLVSAASTTGHFYAWGPQVERRSGASTYIPTTSAPAINVIPQLLTSPANIPRFDHDPFTGESKGLLVEEQRTNLLTYSEQYGSWSVENDTIISNYAVAPDGNLTADARIESTASGRHITYQLVSSVPANVSHTTSVFVKPTSSLSRYFYLYYAIAGDINYAYAMYDVISGTVTETSNGGSITLSNTSITSVGNGWYRVGLTASCSSTANIYTIYGGSKTPTRASSPGGIASGCPSYVGDGVSGHYLWGSQHEAGAFVSSYIPTAASQVTRNSDIAVMTGTNLTSWYNQVEGTIYTEVDVRGQAVQPFVHLQNGLLGYTSCMYYRASGGVSQPMIQWLGSYTTTWDQWGIYNNTVGSSYTLTKSSACYKPNDIALVSQGALIGTDTSAAIPPITSMYIGSTSDNTYFLNSTIRKLVYYPKRLSNAEQQEMTL